MHLEETRVIHVISDQRFASQQRIVLFCLDGQSLPQLLAFVPPEVLSRFVVVGIESNPETRDYDFIRGYGRERFDCHWRFLVQEVIPLIDREYGTAGQGCIRGICGYSNGGTFAHSLAALTSIFSFAIIFSAADSRVSCDEYVSPHQCRYYLAAGIHEPEFLDATRSISSDLATLGVDHFLSIRPEGHQISFWASELPVALKWVFKMGLKFPRTGRRSGLDVLNSAQ